MDHMSTAPVIATKLNDLPAVLLNRIDDMTAYCNGGLFDVKWVMKDNLLEYVITGFPKGKPSDTVMRIQRVLNFYFEEVLKAYTRVDLVWESLFSPSQANPLKNNTNWVSRHIDKTVKNISACLFNKMAYLATRRMVRHLGYSVEKSSDFGCSLDDPETRFHTHYVQFKICMKTSKRLSGAFKIA